MYEQCGVLNFESMIHERKRSMLTMMRNFIAEEDGLEMVEWAIVAALITAGAAAVLTTIGTAVKAEFDNINTALTQ
jgi:Flp pilus assembly pilin Flp